MFTAGRLLSLIFCHRPSWAHLHILLDTLNSSILPAATVSVGIGLGCFGVSRIAFKFQKLYGFVICTSFWCHLARISEAGTVDLTSMDYIESEEKFQYQVPAAVSTKCGTASEQLKQYITLHGTTFNACAWF